MPTDPDEVMSEAIAVRMMCAEEKLAAGEA